MAQISLTARSTNAHGRARMALLAKTTYLSTFERYHILDGATAKLKADPCKGGQEEWFEVTDGGGRVVLEERGNLDKAEKEGKKKEARNLEVVLHLAGSVEAVSEQAELSEAR